MRIDFLLIAVFMVNDRHNYSLLRITKHEKQTNNPTDLIICDGFFFQTQIRTQNQMCVLKIRHLHQKPSWNNGDFFNQI